MRIVVYAVGSPFAWEAIETARRLDWTVAACVRNVSAPVPAGLPRVVDADALDADLTGLPAVIPLVGPGHRRAAAEDARRRGFTELAVMVDPTAAVASSARLGSGTYVNTRAIVAAGVRMGDLCLVNRGASIGHHTELGEAVSIGPGATTGGTCRIGDGAFLGVGAVLGPKVRVGAGAIVGAGAVVVRDVPDGAVVVGNPARIIRHGRGYGEPA